MSKYTGPVCRGSWALGTACKRCERCIETKPSEKQDMGVVTPLPCPFCKWELYAGTLDDGSTCTSVEDGVFWIECPDCFAQGPLEGSEAEAIAAWNHRLASQADQGDATSADVWAVAENRKDAIMEVVGLCNRIPGSTQWNAAEFMYDLMVKRFAIQPDQGEAMRKALEPFAKCVEQIPDDESDDEWAKFRLLIGDYRRAAKAIATHPQPSQKGEGDE